MQSSANYNTYDMEGMSQGTVFSPTICNGLLSSLAEKRESINLRFRRDTRGFSVPEKAVPETVQTDEHEST